METVRTATLAPAPNFCPRAGPPMEVLMIESIYKVELQNNGRE